MVRLMLILGMMAAVSPAMAQDNAKAVREASLQGSRFELLLGKLQDQNEQLMTQVRALQRANEMLAKDVQASSAKSQQVTDEMQRLKNTQLQNLSAAQQQLNDKMKSVSDKTPWGDAQRNCSELGVKHQEIKVSMKPDGTRSVRFLCFDGKALLLGSEVYSANE
ncbi:MAG: hypothetical protein EON60_01980 [Alphaproteobacteria bacterium]|nr:MAG: hypothetical protein EON60_01980 [Alphaproteobacteria bacterium]